MYRKSVKYALFFVYLVMLAGAVVRMTGSGMGCPDWPKCFGHIIPPTDRSQLEWHDEQSFHEGQVIIRNENLQVAVSDFVSGEEFNTKNWKPYTKHDYAKFNAFHTWTEYINRLCGALAGVVVFIMALLSFKKWKQKKSIVVLSWLTVFLMGFQGWLGAVVVYSVLEPIKITIHMLMALLIVAVLLYLLYISKERKSIPTFPPLFKNLLALCLILTLIQVAFGVQVREFIDKQTEIFGFDLKSKWLSNPKWNFYVHRSFSILVVLANAALWWVNKKAQVHPKWVNTLMVFIILEIVIGAVMFYLDFPFSTQTLHLLLATAIFSIQAYLILPVIHRKFTV